MRETARPKRYLAVCVVACTVAGTTAAMAQDTEDAEAIRAIEFGDESAAEIADEIATGSDVDVQTGDAQDFGAERNVVGADTTDADLQDSASEAEEPIASDFRDEDLDREWEEPESDEERDKAELVRSFELYKSSIQNGMYDEADTLAKRIVELSIRLYGINSLDSAKALTNLGIVQYHNKDFDSAQLNYQAAIDIIEHNEDRLNAALINPLKGLGAAQLGAGRPDLAKDSFDRAVHVSHVNEGPHNLLQVELLDALTETYLSAGDTDTALDMQENIYTLQTRNIDLDSEAALPALERQADWMHRLQRYNAERLAYRRMIRILEATRGRDNISLIPPLTGLGKSYLFIEPYDPDFQTYTPASGGEVYLKRALRIAEESPQTNWELVRGSMLALGDFYTLSGRPSRAQRAYAEIWKYLSVDDERVPSRIDNLESPVVLQNIRPTLYYNSTRQDYGAGAPDNFEQGSIVVGFNVTESGRSSDIQLIEARPPGLTDMEDEVMRKVRDLIHRPRLKDGEVVAVGDMTYTHEFFYRQTDVPPAGTDEELSGSLAPDN